MARLAHRFAAPAPLTDGAADHAREGPFHAGQRRYRTGDLARWRSDGGLEFVVRNDQQVKVQQLAVQQVEVRGFAVPRRITWRALCRTGQVAGDPVGSTKKRRAVAGMRATVGSEPERTAVAWLV